MSTGSSVISRSSGRPFVVHGTRPAAVSGPVIVALDDDGHAGELLRHGWAMAERLGVPVRVAYVWSDCRPPHCDHHRRCHRNLGEARRLLTELLDEHLSVEQAQEVEREVLHDADPAEALVALAESASMLVVAASSDRPHRSEVLGATTRSLLFRTACPVAVVPHSR